MAKVDKDSELTAVLRRVAELIGRADADTSWSTYEPDELRSEIGSLLRKAENGASLSAAERGQLRFLFLPTGPLQEVSVSSGWAEEYLVLAARFDDAAEDPR